MCHMNTDAKMINKILANKILAIYGRMHTSSGFYFSKYKKINNVIYHSNSMERWRRAFNKINPLFITKNTQHTMTKRKLFQQNRRHMWKTYNTCHTHGERLRTLAKIRSRPGCLSLPLLFSIFLEELSRANWQEKQIKGIEVGSKLCLYYVCKQME